jgi:RNA polymerase sigma-70 factor (ECF subfamily)
LDDLRLIQRVLAGDARAERELYDAHVDRIYRLTYRMAGDEQLAQDFTQETFIRAFDRLAGFRGDAALSTWLHAIAVSVTLNGLRRVNRARVREADLEEAVHVVEAAGEAEPDLKARLRRAIDALPEVYRVVFVMHDVEGYTHEEIGSVLEVPVGTSKARLSRARARLRDALKEFAKEFVR